MRGAIAVAIAIVLSSCECEPPDPPSEPGPAAEPAALEAIPRATIPGHPPAGPAPVLMVSEREITLDTAALIASWPPADRARVPEATVHVTAPLDGPTPGYRVPAIADGLERAIAIERERAGADVTPTVIAIRASPATTWRRVIEAVYTASGAGFSEPRFVLREGDRDVALAVPLPREPGDARARAEVERALAEAVRLLAETEGAPATDRAAAEETRPDRDAPAPPIEAIAEESAPLHVVLTHQRTVRVSIGARPLAAGCGSVHDAPVDVVRTIDPPAIARCLDAARGAGPAISSARLSADGALPFGEIAAVLELLRARFAAVSLVAPL